ncbi:MAG TPA: hypothetical protein VF457_00550 [Burkholderiaceae bacterium]
MLALPSAAQAQQASLAGSAVARCLSSVAEPKRPVYPEDELREKVSGLVHAEFTFDGPDRAPSMKFGVDDNDDMVDAVRAYGKQLRVPCMAAGGAPVTLRQVFDFVPNDGRKVAWTAPRDAADDARRDEAACIVRPPVSLIKYPYLDVLQHRDGKVLLKLTFVAPDQPPRSEVRYVEDVFTDHERIVHATDAYVQAMRMPCQHGGPVEVNFTFEFTTGWWQKDRHVLKDLPLVQFLGAVKPIPAGSAFFDTTRMKCPFDVRLTLEQPFDPNRIDELDEDVPARHAFLDWLAGLKLELGPKPRVDLLDQTMLIHVPCGTIDL